MNSSTVGIIRRGRRNGESGQAFAELTVSLIAILAAFAGFLLVAVLSEDNVSMSIRARESADMQSSHGISSHGGTSISRWDYGPDTVPFTADDRPVVGAEGDGALFKYQLRDASGRVSFIGTSPMQYDNDFSGLQDSDFFVGAADLADGTASTSNSLKDHGISALESAVRGLFRIDGVEVRDTVYMPAHKDPPD